MPRIIIPDDSGAGWGSVPTVGGVPGSSVPPTTTTPSTTQTAQGVDAAAQAVAQAAFLPPVPAQVIMAVDPTGVLLRWFQILARKLGGYSATPGDDALVSEDGGSSVDLSARMMLADLQVMPSDQTALIADLYRRLDDLTQQVLATQPQGWNRQAAAAAAAPVAPAGGTGTAAGGWDTAVNRDTAIAYLNNVGARLAAVETKLKTVQITF